VLATLRLLRGGAREAQVQLLDRVLDRDDHETLM
jgi:hypothetical protein